MNKELEYLEINWNLNPTTPSELAHLLLTSSTPGFDFSEILTRIIEINNFALIDARLLEFDMTTIALASLDRTM